MNKSGKPEGTTFLTRWSQRKLNATKAAQEGRDETSAVVPGPHVSKVGAVLEPHQGNSFAGQIPDPVQPGHDADNAEVLEKLHSASDTPVESRRNPELPAIDSLTHEADFSPFMAKDVDPGLRNQAMKKLFTDPHYQFGQMDKLDIYIDDYSQPDPIPPEMLRQMYQAKSLFLFDDEEKVTPAPASTDADTDACTPAELLPEAASHPETGVENPTSGNVKVPSRAAENTPENVMGLKPKPVVVEAASASPIEPMPK